MVNIKDIVADDFMVSISSKEVKLKSINEKQCVRLINKYKYHIDRINKNRFAEYKQSLVRLYLFMYLVNNKLAQLQINNYEVSR